MCQERARLVLRLCFLLRHPYSAPSKNRTAFRESRSLSEHCVVTRSRISFYLTFAHDTGCIIGESRADYCGNTVILVLSPYAAMETFYALRVCIVLIFERNRQKNLSLSTKKSFASRNFDYMCAITLKYTSCFRSFWR